MKKNFITSVNNSNKMNPQLFLTVLEYEYDGKLILYIHVPDSPSVCRCNGRIYDRNHEADIDITENQEAVFRLYSRKQNSYFVNKVYPVFKISDLRHDLIDRARRMTNSRMANHPWKNMTDEEMLRNARLILRDSTTGQEGITLASILLFGSDELIISVLGHHKTDAIYRVFTVDRYDDWDVISTNLLESYDRMFEFGRQHLNDNFTLDGILNVSARDKILREIISNSLSHRDYSNAYVAKLVIEKDKIYTENANLSHGLGNLNLASFAPFPKNPAISKVFREIGLADELGSGMRNTYKYTQLYSGGTPKFIEGDIFQAIIPLSEANSAVTVGPSPQATPQATPQDIPQVPPQVEDINVENLLAYCSVPRSQAEMLLFLKLSDRKHFRKKYLTPLLENGKLKMTIPGKPRSPKQKYVKA